MRYFRSRFLLSMLVGAVGMCIAAPAWAAESAVGFRVTPVSGSQLSSGGDYFVLKMEAGAALTQTVEVTNPTDAPLVVRLAAVDAATAQMGGVDYGNEAASSLSTGSWIEVSEDKIDLGPDQSRRVSFQVRVPRDAGSGVHLAGLVVWVEGKDESAVPGSQATMNVQSRRVIAIQVNLPGPARPMLEIRGAQAEARPDGLYLGIELFNSGSGFLKGTGTVSIEGHENLQPFPLDTMVPGTGTNYPFKWASAGVANGSYEVAIEIDYGAATTSWEGTLEVGPALQQDLSGRGVETSSASPTSRYLLITGLSILLALTGLGFRRRSASGRGPVISAPIPVAPRPRELQMRVAPPPPPPTSPPPRPAGR